MGDISINLNPTVPALPRVADKTKIDVRYMVIAPFVSIHVYWNEKSREVIYDVEEPLLSDEDKKNLVRIEQAMREMVNVNMVGDDRSHEKLLDYIDKTARLIISELGISVEEGTYRNMFYYLYRDFIGLNEIEAMMQDYFIEDIECNGMGEQLYIVHRVFRNIKTNVKFGDMDELSNFVEKLAQKTGRYISYASPILDGSLPDGSLDYEEPLIYKEDGLIRVSKIGKFVDRFYGKGVLNKPISVKGIHVPTYNKITLKIEWKELDYVYRHKNKGKLYRLNAEAGKKIDLTGAHSLFVLRNNGIVAEKVSDLRVGDYVVSPVVVPDNNVSKRINVAMELSNSEHYKKFNIKGVPEKIFEEKKEEIRDYLKREYKRFYQAYYELRKKGMLPIKLYGILGDEILGKCEIVTTSSVKIKPFLEISPELMRLLGYYIAEGWTTKVGNHRRMMFCFNKDEIDLIEDVGKCFMDCLGVKVYAEPVKKNARKIVVNSILVWEIFNKILNVSHYAKEKRVPEIVFNVGKNLREEFLKAWHDGDCGSTASKKLAEDISYLSLLNGDVVPFYDRKREGCIEGRKTFCHEFYTNFYRREKTGFSRLVPVEVFSELNKTHWRLRNKRISRGRLKDVLEESRYLRFKNLEDVPKKFIIEWEKRGYIKNKKLTSRGLKLVGELDVVKKLLDSDLGFFRINEIERVKSTKDFVYDVSVPGNESFVGGFGGLMCHNSRVNATYTQDISSKGPTFCFKKGNVQLGDGSVKKIEELFSESKKSYGFKVENGNEVVEPFNLGICGVNENTLVQRNDSKIKSIIKLSPPKKLVRVELEDGGNIEVTPEHLFHVSGDELKMVEAKDLAEGMFVPVPVKVDVEGYRQKVDVYSLIKDFSYNYKTCIISTPEIKNLVSQEIGACNSGGCHRNVMSSKYGVGSSYFYEILSRGNSISFSVLDKLCQNQECDFSSFENVSLNVYGGGTKDKTKSVDVPREIDEDLAYLVGALVSDGNLHENHVNFACYEKGFGNAVKERLERVFGRFDSYYDDNRVYLCNKFVPYFFNKLFQIPIGNKSRIVGVPDLIYKSDNKVVASFLKGLFDGDGTTKSGLSYKTYSKDLAEGITYLLSRLGVYSYLRNSGDEYRVNIPSPYYHVFLKKVGFNSVPKLFHLGRSIMKQIDSKKFIRHDRVLSKPFFDLMERVGLSRKGVTKKCGVSYNRVYYDTISRSFARKICEEIDGKRGSDYQEEYNYLKWLVEVPQEFVRIKNVEIFENSEAVYDIELEPEKFFVAGNKPMNVFDTIRKFTKTPWTPTQLLGFHTMSPEMLAYFWILLQYQSNMMIIGGTASGKTTMLNAIAFFIPQENRVVSIEDTRELNLPRENWLPSVVRGGVSEAGIGEVDMFSLLKSSFRQNPDYVIVGEVRGKEASVLFQGMASGHASISTMHADSVDAIIRRLETPPISLSPMLVNGLDVMAIMTHAIVDGRETRRLREIVEVISVQPDGTALTNTPFSWNPADDKFYFKKDSKIFDKIAHKFGIPRETLQKEFEIRTKLMYVLFQNKVFGYDDVQRVINDYAKGREAVLKKYGLSP